MLIYKLERVYVRIVPTRDEKPPCDIVVGLAKSGYRTGMHPKHLCVGMLFFKSVTVLDDYLGFASVAVLAAITAAFECISKAAG
jgi:hypothetical protein